MKKDFISLNDITTKELFELFDLADTLRSSSARQPLAGKTVALIFQKPSLRTRVSFEVGVHQLGGHPVVLSQEGIGVGTREKASDIAQLLSRYNNAIVARLYDHKILVELAQHSTVPVINALTDLSHPCQILADVYTLRQHKILRDGIKIAFIGDGNNVVNSWLEMSKLIPMHFVLAAPIGYEPNTEILKSAQNNGASTVEIVRSPEDAARNADVLYTDVWISMGQENEREKRMKDFAGFQINGKLLTLAQPNAVVMHCLPAHREEEITADVLEGTRSIVLDEAENRLHIQKAILAKLIGNNSGVIL
ncbi:MAG: ornithine carbamoyltransferase [Bacteroidota bacterium]|nr:ornithine carbamoyltransferase [Bacteroidota bacterium]